MVDKGGAVGFVVYFQDILRGEFLNNIHVCIDIYWHVEDFDFEEGVI